MRDSRQSKRLIRHTLTGIVGNRWLIRGNYWSCCIWALPCGNPRRGVAAGRLPMSWPVLVVERGAVSMRHATVRFTVLGAVRAWRDGTELELGPPQQRAVLALLLVRAGQPTGLNELVDLLWPRDAGWSGTPAATSWRRTRRPWT